MGVPSNGQTASRVLYIRNVPEKVSKQDVARYCAAFGDVQEVLLLKEKRHGFVQFAELESAEACHDFYTEHALAPHGPKIEFAFSGRDEITHKRNPALNPPNRILLVTITNVSYPVTVDVIRQIVGPYTDGRGMRRCVIFSRAESIQALVELATVDDAVTIRNTLDGLNIYPGSNTLTVQYSSMTELHVKANTCKSFDFTAASEKSVLRSPGTSMPENQMKGGVPVCIVRNIDPAARPEHFAALFAVYGNVAYVRVVLDEGLPYALVQMQDALQCTVAQMNLRCVPLHGRKIDVDVGAERSTELWQRDGHGRDFHEMPTYNRHKNDKVSKMYPPSAALHLSNMPDNTRPEEVLAVLRNAGAQVRNFKFLDNLNHIAVVLCTSLDNAVEVILSAHNVPIGSPARRLRVGFGAFRA